MSNEIFKNLKKAVLEFDAKQAANLVTKALEDKIDSIEILDALTEAIREVGDKFGKGEIFLPELIGSSEAMQSAASIIEEEIKKTGGANRESLGTVVVGTVHGDIHNIGKSMVCTLLLADGFEVIDLGIDVEADSFVKAVKEHNADILAMSALLTMYTAEQKKVIDKLKEQGIRDKVKVMVGGGSINEEFAKIIGADGYAPTAPEGVKLAKRLLRK